MVDPKVVTQQLRQVGCDYMFWGHTETEELSNVLMDGERITQAVNGYYDGGFALLCVTNFRVLVVDKKPFLLTVEDLRYDMIAEVDFSSRVFTSVLHVYTPLRTLIFTSWSSVRLRKSMNYIQQRVMEMRNNDFLGSQLMQQALPESQQPQVRTQLRQTPFNASQQRSQHIPQMVPTFHGQEPLVSEFDQYKHPQQPQQAAGFVEQTHQEVQDLPPEYYAQQFRNRTQNRMINPYTKVPLLARRRKYPSFY